MCLSTCLSMSVSLCLCLSVSVCLSLFLSINPITPSGLFCVVLKPFELFTYKFVTFPKYEFNTYSQNRSTVDRILLSRIEILASFLEKTFEKRGGGGPPDFVAGNRVDLLVSLSVWLSVYACHSLFCLSISIMSFL